MNEAMGDTGAIADTGAVTGVDGGGVSAAPEGVQAGSDQTFASQLGEYSNLSEQFSDVQSLAKSYSELRSEFSGRTPPPENGAYELPVMEGYEFDGEQISTLNQGFLESGFTQDQFNFALQQHAQIDIAREAQKAETIKSNLESFQSELGENYQPTLDKANSAIDKINDEGLYELLKNPEFGHNPALIKAFAKIAELSGESTFPNEAQQSGGMTAEAATAKMSELVSLKRNEVNKAKRDDLSAQIEKLHAIIDGQR